VIPGQTGYLAPIGDRVAFAQLAERLLLSPALAQQMGLAGRDRIATEFSVERMVGEYVRLYRDVLAARSGDQKR